MTGGQDAFYAVGGGVFSKEVLDWWVHSVERFFPKKSFTVVGWQDTFRGGVLSKGNPLVFFKGNPLTGERGTFYGGECLGQKKRRLIKNNFQNSLSVSICLFPDFNFGSKKSLLVSI